MNASLAYFAAALVAAGSILSGCATVSSDNDNFAIGEATLLRGGDPYTIRAVLVPELAEGGAELSNIASPLARIADSGGNAVAFDLPGFSPDGNYLEPAAVANVTAIIQRAKDQHMSVLIRVLGAVADIPAARENAVTTAAQTFREEQRAVYWIDGPESGALTAIFKRLAPDLVVVSPEDGDITATVAAGDLIALANGDEVIEILPGQLSLVVGELPHANIPETNFVLAGTDADYAALDAALTTPEERAGWVPDNSVLSQEEREQGFIALLNGKNLDGWWVYGENKQGFRVNEEGAIERAGEEGTALMSVNRYDDFILRLQYRIEAGGNSGVFVRAPRTSRQSRIGMEIQLHGDNTAPPSDDMVGAVYKVVAPTSNASKVPGEWNDLEIMLDGRHMKVTLNGTVIQDINLDDYEELKYRLRKGFIGLQDHDSFVQFKNVRIKPL